MRKFNKNRIAILLDIDRVLFDTENFTKSGYKEYKIYPEDRGAVEKLKKMGKIAVFSQIALGNTIQFQINKLLETGLDRHFNKNDINIHEDKISELKNTFKKYSGLVILVDDLLEVLEEAKKISYKLAQEDFQLLTVWVKRGKHALKPGKNSIFPPDLTVFNLNELSKFLQKKYPVKIE